jgi:hypothetical protein
MFTGCDEERGSIMRGKFVAYYRVSTERQGRSGLGLEQGSRMSLVCDDLEHVAVVPSSLLAPAP